MKLLLDTHTALWLFNEHEKLSEKTKELLLDEKNILYISWVSVWEVAIKTSLGKLTDFSGGAQAFTMAVKQHPIKMLNMKSRHFCRIEPLPFLHRDPFDRYLVAVAMAENMTIVTMDRNIAKYDVATIW